MLPKEVYTSELEKLVENGLSRKHIGTFLKPYNTITPPKDTREFIDIFELLDEDRNKDKNENADIRI